MPKISIVIPTYNCGLYVAEAIGSVLDQKTDHEVEVVVVDDGSTDSTVEAMKTFEMMQNVRYVYQENSGVAHARNRGILESTGAFVGFLDADDTLTESSVALRADLLQNNPAIDMVFSDFIYMDDCQEPRPFLQNREFETTFSKVKKKSPDGVAFTSLEAGTNLFEVGFFIWTGTVLVRKSAFDRIGLFRTDLAVGEDTEMWIRLTQHCKVGYVNLPLACYNRGRSQLTAPSLKYADNRLKFYELLERSFNSNCPKGVLNRRRAWVYHDLGHHYAKTGCYAKASLYFMSALLQNPWNCHFYSLFLAATPHHLGNLCKKMVRKFVYNLNNRRNNSGTMSINQETRKNKR